MDLPLATNQVPLGLGRLRTGKVADRKEVLQININRAKRRVLHPLCESGIGV